MRGTITPRSSWPWIGLMLCCSPLVVESFLPQQLIPQNQPTTHLGAIQITAEQLAKDPFMKQMTYAEEILLPQLASGGNDIEALLKAQLSHSDGIRGFFVAYLTVEDTDIDIPEALQIALKDSISDDLLELACMNVVMPTAVASMHQSNDLQEDSRRTAAKARRVLKYLYTIAPDPVESQCRAILAVATTDETENDDERIQYWRRFFENYGYKERQKKDIANAMELILG